MSYTLTFTGKNYSQIQKGSFDYCVLNKKVSPIFIR